VERHCRNNTEFPRLRVLLLPLEFVRWQRARHWTYAAQLGFEEGLTSNDVEFFTIPVLQEVRSSSPASWLYHAQQLCKDKKFDQVWVWLVHPQYDPEFLAWVKDVAPIRVGFLMESLEYDEQDYQVNPRLRGRKELVEHQMRYMTHILAGDEADAERINRQRTCKAIWYPSAVPGRFLASSAVVRQGPAIFCGALYGERGKWLSHHSLRDLLALNASGEDATEYPRLFDELNRRAMNLLQHSRIAHGALLGDYLNILRSIRRKCFELWLGSLQTGCAVVNLPHLFKSYAGRVVEAMAAGRPVISWKIPNRPRNTALFEDGKEILLFDKAEPEHLADHIRHIQSDPDFARQIAENALRKISRFHTIEKRIRQVLDWIRTGEEPDFGEANENVELMRDGRWILSAGAGACGIEQQQDSKNNSADWTDEKHAERPGYCEFGSSTTGSYCIKSGYRCNLDSNGNAIPYFDDVTRASAYQAEVYRFAAEVIKEKGLKSVLDIGCGFGIKLARYIYPVCSDITGIDVQHAIEFCKREYCFGNWFVDDIEKPSLRLGRKFDLVISADVIEHLANPDALLEYIESSSHPGTYVILSTPERDVARGRDNFGPPANKSHVREWNAAEFRKYIAGYGFDILESFLAKDRDDSQVKKCQVLLCKPGPRRHAPATTARQRYRDTALDYFLQAHQELSRGEFAAAVKCMQAYRSMIDYSSFQRILNKRDRSADVEVSVVIVTYNRTQDLKECLESLSKQDYGNFEVIVVDNGETDFEIVRQYADQYVKCPINFLLSEGRNIGACCARGKIVAFLDDDALVPSTYISSIKAAFETYDIFGLRGKAVPKDDPRTLEEAKGYDRGSQAFPTFCDLEGNSAFLREVFLSLEGMDPLLFGHEGSDLTYRIVREYGVLNKVIYWPETVIYHDAAVGGRKEEKVKRYQLLERYLNFKHQGQIFALRQTIENQSLPANDVRFSFVMNRRRRGREVYVRRQS